MALRRVALSAAHSAAHRGPPLLSRSPLLSAAGAHRSAAVERFAGAQVLFRHATTAATRGTGAVANVPAAGAAGVRRVGARRAADEMRALSKRSFSSDGGSGSGAKSKSADTAKTSPAEPSTSASGSASSSTAAEGTAEPMTLSLMWKRYGVIAIATHFGVYFATLAGLYGGVSAGLMGQGDEKKEAVEKVAVQLEPYVWKSVVDQIRSNPEFGAFAVAWVTAKFTEPVRLVVTMFLVPKIARRLGRIV